jgi:hypothetical protein
MTGQGGNSDISAMRESLYELQMELMQVQREIQIVRRSGFNRLMAAAAASDILFRNTTAVGGGGFDALSKTGITSLTDAGAAGRQVLFYDSTNNRIGMGTATPASGIQLSASGSDIDIIRPGGGELYLYASAWTLGNGFDTWQSTVGAGGIYGPGWVLPKGVHLDMGKDFQQANWGAVGASTGFEMQTSITAQTALINNVRGGIVRTYSIAAGAPNWIEMADRVHFWSAQDAYRIYTRFAVQQIANFSCAVGTTDGPAGVNPYGAVAGNGVFVVLDTAVGGTWLLRTVVGAAVTDVDTLVNAVAGDYVVFDILVATTKIATLYINGTLKATSAAANSPLATTMLEPILWVAPLGAAVLAQLDVDTYKIVESRNTATTA